MKDWNLMLFEEIVEFPPKVKLEKGQMYSFIPMEDIDGVNKYVSPKGDKEWKGTGGAKFEDGDTLFARITPCLQNGKISQAKNLKGGKGFGSTEYFIFRGVDQISDSDYIYYLAQTSDFRNHAIGSMVGASGRQRADAKYVGNYEVRLPPLDTQKMIASVLCAYDDLIENNLNRIKLLEEFAQRTYEEWFMKFRVNGVQLDINEGSGLPEGWIFGSLGDIISFQNGFAFKSSQFVLKGQPVIKIKNIVDNTVNIGNTDFVDKDYAELKASKFSLKEGDLLIAMTGATVGKVGYMPFSKTTCYMNQRVGRFVPLRRNNIHYVFAHMTQGDGLKQVLNLAGGAAQPNISGSQILALKTVIPGKNFLEMYGKLAEINHKQIQNLIRQNQILVEARDILLPRLMSGQINIKDVPEELVTAV